MQSILRVLDGKPKGKILLVEESMLVLMQESLVQVKGFRGRLIAIEQLEQPEELTGRLP